MAKRLVYNTALIVLDGDIQRKNNIHLALNSLQDVGIMIDRTAIIRQKTLQQASFNESYNGATVLHTLHTQQQLYTELRQIEQQTELVNLHIVTFNKSIVEESEILKKPFFVDYIKQLQPEVFTWR